MNRRITIEDEVFRKSTLREESLIPFGFERENEGYCYVRDFHDGAFRAEVRVLSNGRIYGRVMENDLDEEYLSFRLPTVSGYAAQIRQEYETILKEVAGSCFEKQNFSDPQANRLASLIRKEYGVEAEFLFKDDDDTGVFRNPLSEKWFGIIMNIRRNRLLPDEEGSSDVMNLKVDVLVNEFIKREGVFPAWHMNKKNWISVILDDTLSDEAVMEMVRVSYELSLGTREWLVPANPAYYDVLGAFEKSDVIEWKQSNNIKVGDTVYLYVGQPYSAIMFKCEVLETDIPYDFHDENLTIRRLMRIRKVREYPAERFTFAVLNSYGVNAVRGPRGIPPALSETLNRE
ncbi:MAG: MmcQ/YjbR family DNA-binding protein [Erysipelotrichaceae bacterium]|nr:MmcQ/YjbR family DNA-binding protein [Erysipelotrichaceae bacterium]